MARTVRVAAASLAATLLMGATVALAADGAEPLADPPAEIAAPPRERIEADVSARSIAVTAAFKGSEVIVFGSVEHSRQPSPESGYYDVVVTVEGAPGPTVVRRKSEIAGLWINTAAARFQRTPSYLAIASTRPIEEIAEEETLRFNAIGFQNIDATASADTLTTLDSAEVRDFRAALGRLKAKEGLYTREDYGVTFIGRSLFRSTIALPANIPVGPLVTRIHLFRDGKLLDRFTTRVTLQRTGLERFIHEAAHTTPVLYGLAAVALAMLSGLLASAVFNRAPR